MHTILIRNDVYNVLRISLNRNTLKGRTQHLKLWKKTLFHVWIRPYYLAINWAIWSLKLMWSCICLIGDCKRAVKISTCQIQMRSWLVFVHWLYHFIVFFILIQCNYCDFCQNSWHLCILWTQCCSIISAVWPWETRFRVYFNWSHQCLIYAL